MLSISEIQEIIRHRYPFLLVDKIIEIEPGIKAVGIKNFTINEFFFQGHFPNFPVVPGALIVEALAQTACIAIKALDDNKDKLELLTGIELMKFKKKVIPGDVLTLVAEILYFDMGKVKSKVFACVNNEIVAEGEIKLILKDAN